MLCPANFDKPGMYCMPDLMLFNGGTLACVFVNGLVHDKDRVRRKDIRIKSTLQTFGYVVFIVKNETIDNSPVSALRGLAYAIWQASANEGLYHLMHRGEKELPGFAQQ
jgi:hypothetical protein